MLTSRECDRREAILTRQGKAAFHMSCSGHEGLAGLAQVLKPGDLVFPHYRDRALMLALGMPVADIARQLFGKAGSSGEGRQLPGHFGDRERGVWHALSPVAHHLLPACGAAWAMRRRKSSTVAVAMVGEASCRQGEFFEAVAFAAERRLPVLFVVEDNHLGISTPTDALNPLALGLLDGLPVTRVEARNPQALFDAALPVVERLRTGAGPAILWCDLDRLDSHSNFDDQRAYLAETAIRRKWEHDPVAAMAERLSAAGLLSADKVAAEQKRIADEVQAVFAAAIGEPEPSPAAALDDRLAPMAEITPPPVPAAAKAEWTMAQAVNLALKDIFRRDDDCLLFGQDVEDPKGGAFGLTRGMTAEFAGRIHNSPLAEATIAGVAAGLASTGIRPFIELQFVDFCGPAFSQIVNDLATLRWRSGGKWNCPAVIYATYGGYVAGAGIWHSQAYESVFCQVPGLRVVVPSSPADAAALFWTAAQADDPTVILLPKRLFRVAQPVPERLPAIPFGKAELVVGGDELTVVCWGNTVRVVQQAARLVEGGPTPEILDLRSLSPWDAAAVRQSVGRTGRLLVVQEENVTCSLGQAILAEIAADRALWRTLKCPPRLLGRPDVHVGFNGVYGDAYLPQPKAVADVIREMTGEA